LVILPNGEGGLVSDMARLGPTDCFECELHLTGLSPVNKGVYPISLLQLLDGEVVGAVHWFIRSRPNPR
jgi:hypothetical protein